jgi:hypothetical protein
MRRYFLILLAMLIPLQAVIAAERSFAHAMEAQQSEDVTLQHMQAHAEHIPHHHHDDGGVHEDDSQASIQHLLDCDHGFSVSVVLPADNQIPVRISSQMTPAFEVGVIPSRTTSPPLRPPHAPA